MKTLICFFLAAPLLAAEPTDNPIVAAVQKAMPAVVNISTEQVVDRFGSDPFEEMFRQYFGRPRRGVISLGSGVIVDGDGWIVTNYHVVRRASKITVTLADGSSYEARVVSGDEKNDLVLLKVEVKEPLPFLEIATDREVLLGETVLAIGNPYGYDHTVTRGILSAKNRKYPPDDPMFEDILQTDAAINPGNSGGPLIDTRGELVGINMAILSNAEGIGFAIPAKRVAALLTTWFSPEKRARLWLGLRFARVSGQLVVAEVEAGSPAAKAGLREDDVITNVDGQRFTNVLPLQRYLIHKRAGDELKFQLTGGRHVEVKLAALPKLSAQELMLAKFGVSVQPLTEELANAFGISVPQGLLVADVQRGSPAADAGLRRGVVILRCAGEDVDSLDKLAEQLADIKTGEAVSFLVSVTERRGPYTVNQAGSVTLKAR
jgi:S1-C subfamily serine protease